MLNPVPVAPTFRDDTDTTIAVNLSGAAAALPKLEERHISFPPIGELKTKIDRYIENISLDLSVNSESRLGLIEMIVHSIDTMQGAIARHKLAAYPPDIILEVPRNCCGTLEFDRAAEMIELGYSIAAKSISR